MIVAASRAMSNPIPLIRIVRQVNVNRMLFSRDIFDMLLTNASQYRSRNSWPFYKSSTKESMFSVRALITDRRLSALSIITLSFSSSGLQRNALAGVGCLEHLIGGWE